MVPLGTLIPGGGEIAIVAVVALVLFGSQKIGGFMRSLGEGAKEFKRAVADDPSPLAEQPVGAVLAAQEDRK
jgi:TatA/E family protein of Tat protein translocase